MFDVERLVEQCQGALKETDASGAVRAILERTVSEPAKMLASLGEPKRATVQKIHVADELTIINVVWGSHMTIMPHNHKMAAIIGVYTTATVATTIKDQRERRIPPGWRRRLSRR